MDSVRLRVVFGDRQLLGESQKSEGLKRSWLLLQPQHETISDLSTYLTHIFDLHHSCPNGVILSMDGFVLPPFESTCILKDKDVIRVKRKRVMLSEIVEVGDGAYLIEDGEIVGKQHVGANLVEDGEIVEKQPVLTSVPLLANEEFEKETGGYQSEAEEDEDNRSEDELLVDNSSGGNANSKKRKAPKKLQSLKKKKSRMMVPQDIENDFQVEQNERSHNGGRHRRKSIDKKEKLSHVKSKPKRARSPERNNDVVEPLTSSKREGKLQENGAGCVDVLQTPDGTRKISRSSRRKKAKRKWLRELSKDEKEELQLRRRRRQSPEKDISKNIEHQAPNQNGEADDEMAEDAEIVPIVIRPGHIRFEPLGKDQAVQQSQVSMETFQWNGIISKKKGQKWGKENFSSCGWNHYKGECSELVTIKKGKPGNDPIDFDRLAPFTSLPKEGDVIAYRLLELSSTWTPELSSFRVGKISRYYPQSNRVLLRPVRGYPIIFEKKPDEDAGAQPDNSLYGKDGSLRVDFSSLIDVRIVKLANSDPAKAVTGTVNGGPIGNEVTKSTVSPSNNDKQAHAPTTPEKVVNVWDEVSEALSAKKAQLTRNNGWSNGSTGTSSWSHRGSALGPTMAWLRARNDI